MQSSRGCQVPSCRSSTYSPDMVKRTFLPWNLVQSSRGCQAPYSRSPTYSPDMVKRTFLPWYLVQSSRGCQVPSVHIHNEHRDHSHNGDHHQLELSYSSDAPHATLDPSDLPQSTAAGNHEDQTLALVSLVPHTASSLSGLHFSRESQRGAA